MPTKKKSARKGGLKKRSSRSLANGHAINGNGVSNGHTNGQNNGHVLRVHGAGLNGSGPALNEHGRLQVPCLSCGICCTYVAAEVDGPSGVKSATEILWYLYHDRVSVYRDDDDEWLLQFEARCQHLQADNKCRIYEQRPHICRAFDEKNCEINVEHAGQTFHTPREFLAYLQEHHRAIYRKLEGRFLPPEDTWDGQPANPQRLPPFKTRYRRLRVLGSPPV